MFLPQTGLGHDIHGRVLHVALLELRLYAPDVPAGKADHRVALISNSKESLKIRGNERQARCDEIRQKLLRVYVFPRT